jgi:tetratricopeptide (TPR) repeat protein
VRQALEHVAPGQISPTIQLPDSFAIVLVVPDVGSQPPVPSSVGDVRFTLDIDGLAQADIALGQFPKADGWNEDPGRICQARRQTLDAMRSRLSSALAAEAGAGQEPASLANAHIGLGQLDAYDGRMDQAIAEFEAADRLAPPEMKEQLDEALGILYLHGADVDNEVLTSPGDRCLLPVKPGRPYAKTAKSLKAVEHFQHYLAASPDTPEVRWLLNIAYMQLGTYPASVPPQFLIPPSVLASAEEIGHFTDVAPAAGLKSVASSGGAIVDDFDNDGWYDVVTSSSDSCAPMHFFHGRGDGTFEERTTQAGLDGQVGGLNLIQADYDNDGFLDILNLRGGWQLPQRNSLLHNNGNGTFTDVTVPAGLAAPTSTQTAVWTDIDNDGFLDLFVGNENAPAQLFVNRHDGTFEDIAASAGVNRTAFTKGVAAGDFDNDGYPDLYVSNFDGVNFLYRNNHDRTFTELAAQAGVQGTSHGFATWFFDYDNDGKQDLFVTSFFMSLDETVRTYLGEPHHATTLKLFRNRGDGTFEDVTTRVGLDKVFMPMGSNFGDLDNDGFLDIYLGTGSPSYGSTAPNVLLHNHGGQSFVDVTASAGMGERHKGHGVAFADFDNDGDEDVLEELGGATPGDAHALRLFENPGHGNDWVRFKLVGSTTNRSAIGARITVIEQDAEGRERSIYRVVGSGGSFGASPLERHVGLGRDARITAVDVFWPGSRTHQRFTGVQKNHSYLVREGTVALATLDRPVVRLGGARATR